MSRSYRAARRARQKTGASKPNTVALKVGPDNTNTFGKSSVEDFVGMMVSRYMESYVTLRKCGIPKPVAHHVSLIRCSTTKAVEGVYEKYPVQGTNANIAEMCHDLFYAVNDPEWLEAVENGTAPELAQKRREEKKAAREAGD